MNKNILKFRLLGLVLTALTLGACQTQDQEVTETEVSLETSLETTEDTERKEVETSEEASEEERAAKAYKDLVEDHENITYLTIPGFYDHDKGYSYGLANLSEDGLPSLLLARNLDNYKHINIYSYNPEKDQVISWDEGLAIGMPSAGASRSSLFASNEGKGLIFTDLHATSGNIISERISLKDREFSKDLIQEYNISDKGVKPLTMDEIA